ncbi:ubiquitin-specific protease doa4 [Sporothrix epigloea]|uniref:Ubiquitin-specific protease doa4 n=1 Tax=Sporothrix epigloea TaxID=1892477 RepID=A0ABP0DFU9_9PEZI
MAGSYGSGPSVASTNGENSSPPPSSGKVHNYMHFDDIKHAKLGVDSVTPIDTVLGYAESCIKQADFMKDYGRLDMALKEYIMASIALLEVLPSNSAWMSVMTDQKGARVRYNSLMARISASSAAYEVIKVRVKEDNARSGIQPKVTPFSPPAPPPHQQQSNGTSMQLPNGGSGHRVTGSLGRLNGNASPPSNPAKTMMKTKPAIQPKPQALHGNAIKPGGSKTAQELAERFANLRVASSPAKEPIQDPRIRTQSINHPSFQQLQKLQTQLPSSKHISQNQSQNQQNIYNQFQSPLKGIEPQPRPPGTSMIHAHALPDLPKLPDAIYSPARGCVSIQSPQMPVTTPRSVVTPRGGRVSMNKGASASTQTVTEDYFSTPYTHSRQTSRPSQDSARPKKSSVSIPQGDTISAQKLLQLIQAGSKDVHLLLVDIRSREEFDEGHIMSQSTICVEADVLQREDISASQIADSMVLAPTSEQRLFDQRGDADLVVFYDDDSESVQHNNNATTETERAVTRFYNALAHYDYQSDSSLSSARPRLLRGGLEAWISLMGPHSLQTSSTASGETASNIGSRAAAIRAARAAQQSRQNTMTRRHFKYMAKPIQDADEAKRWEESLADMDKSASLVRTTDDFLRRFPPVSEIKESMTTTPTTTRDDGEIGLRAPTTTVNDSFAVAQPHNRPSSQTTFRSGMGAVATASERHGPVQLSSPASRAVAAATTTTDSLYSTLPSPPTRPSPTVPRQTHNDLTEIEDEEHYMRTKLAKAGVTGGGRVRRQKVGLYNPGNWCYGNSSLQSMFASGAFADELTAGEWLNYWKVPMKADEKISHPQLLAKILANSFHWMQHGKFEAMKAKTLMDYCYHIHSRDFDGSIKMDRSTIFGGPYQQDAQEFISFLLENLHDETNRLRNRAGEVQQPPLNPRSTALGNALLYWNEYRKYNDSLVDKYWRGVEVTDRRCRACGHPSLTYEHFDAIHLPIPPNTATTATTMADLLGHYCGADLLPEYKCDQCRRIDTTEKRVRLVRLPDLLCVSFRRFQGNEHYGFRKNNTAVVFPINGLDLTPYTVQGMTAPEDQKADGLVPEDGPGRLRTEQQFCGPFVYDCYAVIVHSGTLKSGHYRSFIKDEGAADTNQWHHFDDARIEPVTIGSNDSRDLARRLYRDNQSSGASAYMVFYKRRK